MLDVAAALDPPLIRHLFLVYTHFCILNICYQVSNGTTLE